MRILTLIENTCETEKLFAEHGLSFYIEHNGEKFLIDTGASDNFLENANRMRVDLSDVKKVIISHNHYDHTGGLEAFLKFNPTALVFARANANVELFKKVLFFKFPIGQIKFLSKKYPNNFLLYTNFQEISSGLFLLGNEFFDKEYFCKDDSLKMKVGKHYLADDFAHEAFAVIFPKIDKTKGCVVISSCSHSGIVNIIKTVKYTYPESPILAIIGGFHTMGGNTKKINCSPEYLKDVANKIKELDVGTIYTCHCTGMKGYSLLKAELGDQLQYLQTGEELEF